MKILKFLICFFPLILLAKSEEPQKARICLNMIVKNESHVIERALASVKGFIDQWVIVDTGSEDDTPNIIRSSLQDIPGELHKRPWKNFGYNRTEALELARGKADYILFLDADDWLAYDTDFTLPALHADIYWAPWQSQEMASFTCLKPLIVKDSLPCKWEGIIHEYLTCDHAQSQLSLEGLRYIFTNEGIRSKTPKKYEEAAHILEKALEKEPHNARYAFYLAQSYRDADLKEKALAAYQRRTSMGDWQEEIFWSWLEIGQLQYSLGYSKEEVIASFEKAHKEYPSRSEPIYHMAEVYNLAEDYEQTYTLIKRWMDLPKSFSPISYFEWAGSMNTASNFNNRLPLSMWVNIKNLSTCTISC